MRQTQNRLLKEYRRIAEEFGLTIDEVKELESFQWKFVKEQMGKGHDEQYGTFEHIYLRYLGTFYASKDMLKYIERNKDKRKKDDKST